MSIKAFLKPVEEEEFTVYPSNRYKEEDGTLAGFKIRPIDCDAADQIKENCYEPVVDPQTKQVLGRELNTEKYTEGLLVASIVDPDLHDKDLQEKFGTKAPVKIFRKMLNFAERNRFFAQAGEKMALNENETINSAEIDAKNA